MTYQLSSDGAQIHSRKTRFALLVATFFYSGYLRRAPGTWASLLTTMLWAAPIYFGISPIIRIFCALCLFLIGIWASKHALAHFGDEEDPSAIVIDEVAGQTLALALCPASFIGIVAGFLLFRLFDIVKPGPIGWLDRNIKGGLGIMLDDMAAGFVTLVLIFGGFVAFNYGS